MSASFALVELIIGSTPKFFIGGIHQDQAYETAAGVRLWELPGKELRSDIDRLFYEECQLLYGNLHNQTYDV
jgi:hypothetical protein